MARPDFRARLLARKLQRPVDALQAKGARAAVSIGRRLSGKILAAWRKGHDPRLLIGPVSPEIVALGRLIRAGMVASHLQGRLRVLTVAASRPRRPLRLASTAFDETLAFLEAKLGLDEFDAAQLVNTYGPAAINVAQQFGETVNAKLGKAILEATKEGLHVEAGMAAIKEAFQPALFAGAGGGETPGYLVEAIFRTQTQLAYSAGQYNANQDDAIQDILWGYVYSAVEDDRTTELCSSLDGTQLPQDDPFWNTFFPPNHWSCRSMAIEIFKDDDPAPSDLPDNLPAIDPEWAFNPGQLFGDILDLSEAVAG
jgi:SPP1 gp7 family putative phage head morphogenesis protein